MRDRDQTNKTRPPQRRQATCPVCKRRVTVAQDDPSQLPRFFPFCSARCKLIDLGAWLDGDYRIPSKPDEESEAPPGRETPTESEDPPA
jgi:endogenous inhibitor of DNA gyrase (YacG/DUF329 family)